MGITDRILELKRLLDEILPELLIQQVAEEGELEALSKTELERAEEYFDAAIALMEHKLESRIKHLEKRGFSARGDELQKRVNEIGHRVGVMLHPDLTYVVIVTSIYSNGPAYISSNLPKSGIKSTIDVIQRDWDKLNLPK